MCTDNLNVLLTSPFKAINSFETETEKVDAADERGTENTDKRNGSESEINTDTMNQYDYPSCGEITDDGLNEEFDFEVEFELLK